MLLSAMGVGALLAASEAAFTPPNWLERRIWSGLASGLTGSGAPVLDLERTVAKPWNLFYLQGLLVHASNLEGGAVLRRFFPNSRNPWRAHVCRSSPSRRDIVVASGVRCPEPVHIGVSRLIPVPRSSGRRSGLNRVCGGLFTLIGGLRCCSPAVLLSRAPWISQIS